MVENLPANAGDVGSFPGLGRSPRGGNGNLLQYSCLGNPMDRGAQQTTVHGMNHKRVEQDLELNNNNMLWVEDYFSTHNISDTKYVFL